MTTGASPAEVDPALAFERRLIGVLCGGLPLETVDSLARETQILRQQDDLPDTVIAERLHAIIRGHRLDRPPITHIVDHALAPEVHNPDAMATDARAQIDTVFNTAPPSLPDWT